MKKILAMLLALCMVFALVACGGDPVDTNTGDTGSVDTGDTGTVAQPDTYTYNSYTTALGSNWNPHTWETSADDSMLGYVSSPFCTMQALDTENGVYQWIYEMATEIIDVTADYQGDLTKYNVTLPAGVADASEVTSGYVYQIKLNPNAAWENGEAINADDYIYSMQQLLNPKMHNYRANLYVSGESALAGAYNYYNSGAPLYAPIVPAYGSDEEPDYSFDWNAALAEGNLYLNVSTTGMTLASYTLDDLVNYYNGGVGAEYYTAIADAANVYGYTLITADNLETAKNLVTNALAPFGLEYSDELFMECLFYISGYGDEYTYDTVGCYKVDDYTINYVCQTQLDINYFLTSCTSTWLVYEELYEAGKDTSGELVTTNYGTSVETTMSYGPYRLSDLQKDKQVIYVQNENWYDWEKQEDGSLLSFTDYTVDGKENVQRYQTTKIVINVMDEAAAKQAFLKGELTSWAPNAEELVEYAASDVLYKVDETYTMSFFFNTDLNDLKEMDNSKGNTNSVVLSNYNFRKAFSLAIDRAEWVTATEGYKPAYSLMNNLYYYDVYNDPTSSYRNSEPAMQAICNLYGVEYGEGTPYATLADAYKSINGYNLTEAQALMAIACQELVDAGLYTAGSEIYIRVAYKKGAIESPDQKQIALMNEYLNAAIEGSGFGKITLEAVGNLEDRYGAVPSGEYAIGYGAWGGAAFYPFRNLQVYCDSSQYELNEAACWNPAAEELTLTVNGEEVTMTWQAWSNALIGVGQFANADFETKLQITAELEQKFLEKMYRIPLAGTCVCELLGYQVSYYTEDYNIMYGFGGLELMTYNYSDAEWAEFVASNPNGIDYT